MKAVISCTEDEKYCWYIPVVIWVWNKFGIGVILFLPESSKANPQMQFCLSSINDKDGVNKVCYFGMPTRKEATASQCVRLYASAIDLPEDETIVISDIDMFVFNPSYFHEPVKGLIDIYGADLVPPKQYPMCYGVGQVGTWRTLIGEGTVQEHLDRLLGDIECDNMRGNYWGKDQETLWNLLNTNDEVDYRLFNRAKPGTQFATNRLDRDDAYILERLSPDIVDYHANRPGYEPHNFQTIMAILNYFFPHEDLSWIYEYDEKFKQLL